MKNAIGQASTSSTSGHLVSLLPQNALFTQLAGRIKSAKKAKPQAWQSKGRDLFRLGLALNQTAPPKKSTKQIACELALHCTNVLTRGVRALPAEARWNAPLQNGAGATMPLIGGSALTAEPDAGAMLPLATTVMHQERMPGRGLTIEDGGVFQLLQKHGYLSDSNQHDTVSGELVNAAIDFVLKGSQEILARTILHTLGEVGGNEHEKISASEQLNAIRKWMELRMFDGNLEDWIVRCLATRSDQQSLTTIDFAQLIKAEVYSRVMGDTERLGSLHDASIVHWIWKQVIEDAVPLLRYAQQDDVKSLDVKSYFWGATNAALLLFDCRQINVDSAFDQSVMDTGDGLLAIWLKKKNDPEYFPLFRLHARIVYLAKSQEEMPEHGNAAAIPVDEKKLSDYYLGVLEKYLSIVIEARRLAKQIQEIKPRGQGAFEACGGTLSLEVINNSPGGQCNLEKPISFNDPTKVYASHVKAVTAQFAKVDGMALDFVFSALSREEHRFVMRTDAVTQRMTAAFSPVHEFRSASSFGGNPYSPSILTMPCVGVDIFSVKPQGEERIYVLRASKSGFYEVERVDRDAKKYYKFTNDASRVSNTFFTLKLNALDGKLNQVDGANRFAKLRMQLLDAHKKMFYEKLFSMGYNATYSEKREAFVKDVFVPFYACVQAIKREEYAEAAISCGADVVNLALFLGTLASVSLKAAGVLSRSALHASRAMRIVEFQQHGLRSTGLAFQRSLAIEFSPVDVGREVAVALFRLLDPGIEFSTLIAPKGWKIVRSLASVTDVFPATKTALSRFPKQLEKNWKKADLARYRTGRLVGIEGKLLVKKIASNEARQGIYAAVRYDVAGVESTYGRKYIFADQYRLEPMPISSGSRTNPSRKTNFCEIPGGITHRISRRSPDHHGAPLCIWPWQSLVPSGLKRLYQPQIPDVNVDVLNELRQGAAHLRGVDRYVRDRGISRQLLEQYVSSDGRMTSAGNDLYQSELARIEQLRKKNANFNRGKWPQYLLLAHGNEDQRALLNNVVQWRSQVRSFAGPLQKTDMLNFCKNQKINCNIFLAYVGLDGALSPRGIMLAANFEGRALSGIPLKKHHDLWEQGAVTVGNNRNSMVEFAQTHQLDPLDWERSLPSSMEEDVERLVRLYEENFEGLNALEEMCTRLLVNGEPYLGKTGRSTAVGDRLLKSADRRWREILQSRLQERAGPLHPIPADAGSAMSSPSRSQMMSPLDPNDPLDSISQRGSSHQLNDDRLPIEQSDFSSTNLDTPGSSFVANVGDKFDKLFDQLGQND